MLIESWSQWLRRVFQATQRSHPIRRKRRSFLPAIESLEDRITPDTVTLTPSADNTLYQDTTGGNTSNGAGQHLYTGATNTHGVRRAVLKFDVSTIPAAATITSASLTLFVARAGGGGPAQTTELHRLTKAWGEGTYDATQGGPFGEGDGTTATPNDATWVFNFFDTQSWTAQGGDFSATVSASTQVAGANTRPTWTGAGLVTDVQGWLANSATNFGWIVIGNESAPGTAKEFDSRENPTTGDRPTLVVNYTAPGAHTPSVTGATTNEDTQTTSGLVISRNPADGAEVTHFKITNITNGALFQNNGTTAIANNALITFAQGNAGLKFTPSANFFGSGTFTVQASLSNTDAIRCRNRNK